MKKLWLLFFISVITLYAIRIYAENSELLISEVQITGGTGKTTNDYIKIYNNTDNILNLFNYRLVKRTETANKDTLIKSWTELTPLLPKGFYLWANSDNDFATTTKADCFTSVTISDDNGIAIRQKDTEQIIDSIAWGDVPIDFAFTETKAISPYTHKSPTKQIFSRKNNQDTNNNKNDFEVIDTNNQNTNPPTDNNPTSNTQNQISNFGGGNAYCQAMKGDVLINEFLSSPSEDEDEWVELISNCSQMVNLENWTLEDGSGTKTILSGTFDKYFVIDAPKVKLNNAGDVIILKNNNGQIIDEVVYGTWQVQRGPKAPGISQSLALDPNTHEFVLSTKPTKSTANVIEAQSTEETTTTKTVATSSPIIIGEILPNPFGADADGEFIELFNQSAQTISLKDWKLTNEAGQIFIFPNIVMTPTTSAAFFKIVTNLSLKNDRDTIKLYTPGSKTTASSVSYKNAPDGQSYLYDTSEKIWLWSLGSTPNKPNILIKPNTEPTAIFYAPDSAEINEQIFLDASDSFDPVNTPLNFFWDFGDKATSTQVSLEHTWTKAGNFTIKLTASDGELDNTKVVKIKIIDPKAVPELAVTPLPIAKAVSPKTTTNNSLLKINAIVVTPPGLFGAQWFYAMPLDDSNKSTNTAIQIYNNKKEFPTLKIGDLIEVQGELYAITDDMRLKTKALEDITVIEHDNILIEKTVAIGDLNKNLANELISVSGKVSRQQGNNIILSDGAKELLIELKPNTKLRAKDFTPESSYQITGILKQASDQLKLWPRGSDDIILLGTSQVLGEKIESSSTTPTATINFVSGKGKEKTLEYLLITALGLIVGLSVLLFKFKKAPTD
jgi:PKD repeat protein